VTEREELLAEFESAFAEQEMQAGDVSIEDIMRTCEVTRSTATRRGHEMVKAGKLTTATVRAPNGRLIRVFRKNKS
jgi:hypothetical protein